MRRGLGWFERGMAPVWFSRLAARCFAPVDGWLGRVSKGRWGFGQVLGAPSLLLVTTGRSSGLTRRSPLLYVPWQGSFAVVGSNFGKDQHPGWTANLLACPEASVVVGGREVAVRARLVSGTERVRLWSAFVAMARSYQAYEQRCDRGLRLFLLEPLAKPSPVPAARSARTERGETSGPVPGGGGR
ncbi:nitroreductase/quinone reductase family protein [Streptomyces sp. NPDC096094]|uniref:nitroreductase/quinone reductase family protein n=1 Tax=Streptomyces sp. NPDC096094 TaxID=3366073 RepID=UPI0038306AF6